MVKRTATRIIRIEREVRESGMIFATSPDLPGLLVGGRTEDELMAEIPAAISALFEAHGVAVETYPAVTDAQLERIKVLVPEEEYEGAEVISGPGW